MPSERPAIRFQHIVENIQLIRQYAAPLQGWQDLARNPLHRDAIERCLQRICEAARILGPIAEELAPDQPWHEIRRMGNVLRHDYEIILEQVIWDTVVNDLDSLEAACLAALERLEGEDGTL